MARITGSLSHVTGDPDLVTSVGVSAVKVRPNGSGLITTSPKQYPVTGGKVAFPCEPGMAQLTIHYLNSAVESVPLLVPDTASATLAFCFNGARAEDLNDSDLEKVLGDLVESASTSVIDAAKKSVLEWVRGLDDAAVTQKDLADAVQGVVDGSADQMGRGSGERYLSEADHLDNEKPGTAQVHAGVAAAVGAPDGHQGTVFTSYLYSNAGSRIQWYIGRAPDGQYHVRYRYYGRNGWGDWQYSYHPETFVEERARIIPDGTDWNTLTEGEWRKRVTPSTPDPNSPLMGPGITPIGVLRVLDPGYTSTGGGRIQVFYAYADKGIFLRSSTAQGVWREWRRIDEQPTEAFVEERARVIPDGTDWNTLAEGEWRKTRTPTKPDPNSALMDPGITPIGVLRVFDPGYNTAGGGRIQVFYAYANKGIFFRSATAQGQWREWSRLDEKPVIEPHAQRHRVLEDEFRKRRLGTVGTGGRKAVALRFDHHLIQFRETVLPLLKERGLPWAQILNPDNMGKNNDAVAAASVQAWALVNGGEIWNHGGNHADATGEKNIYDQVVGSKQRLQAQFPRMVIDSWAPPGLPDGGYDGYFGKTPVESADTYAAQIIWGHHAAVAGYAPDNYHPLDGRMRTFLKHRTIDTAKLYHVQRWLDDMPDGHGMALMLHPVYVDRDGYIDLATLTQILDELVKRRDAGELDIVSYSGLFIADAGRAPQRLAGAPAGEVKSTWKATIGEPATITAGAVHELSAWVKTTPGETVSCTITAKTPVGDVVTSREFTLKDGVGRVSEILTPPVDTTEVTVSMTGNFTHTGIYYRPI